MFVNFVGASVSEDNLVNVKLSLFSPFFNFSFLIMKTAKSHSRKSVLSVIHSDTSKVVFKSRLCVVFYPATQRCVDID